jgi:hypothetical protein
MRKAWLVVFAAFAFTGCAGISSGEPFAFMDSFSPEHMAEAIGEQLIRDGTVALLRIMPGTSIEDAERFLDKQDIDCYRRTDDSGATWIDCWTGPRPQFIGRLYYTDGKVTHCDVPGADL